MGRYVVGPTDKAGKISSKISIEKQLDAIWDQFEKDKSDGKILAPKVDKMLADVKSAKNGNK